MKLRTKGMLSAALLASLLALGGCAAPGGSPNSAVHRCDQCGVIQSITSHDVEDNRPNAGGAIAGAIIGGVIGHQFGGGRGQDAATAAGAVGGAAMGSQAGRGQLKRVYDMVVRMDSGEFRNLTVSDVGGLRVGDRVEVGYDRIRQY